MNNKIAIIDYGLCNLLNVYNAISYVGGDADIIDDPKVIGNYSHIVLPGVGAFKDGMEGLRMKGLIDPIIKHSENNKPLLGICLGMQMMLEKSYEFEEVDGLGIIKGDVIKIPNFNIDNNKHKIPHIGWNEINYNNKNFKLPNNMPMYFVHSYMAKCDRADNIIATCNYNKIKIESIIGIKNSYGCQFHPEKSGKPGLEIINKFINL
tara:strand:- start:671 stop:1291 length:621 start_codon:yes stop_codon:yes gene_type:complete